MQEALHVGRELPRWLKLLAAVGVAVALSLIAHGALASTAPTPAAQYAVLNTGSGSNGLVVTDIDHAAEVAARTTGPMFVTGAGSDADPRTAHRVSSGDPDVQLWAAKSSNGGVCVLTWVPKFGTRGPASVCSAEGKSASAGVVSELGGTDKVIAGVVPDGVASVELTSTGGKHATVSVASNAYIAKSTESVASVAFDAPDGHHQVNIGGAK